MESRSGKSEVRWTYKQLYRVHLWPHLNKSSHSETALSNITFSLYSFLLCHITLWQRLSLSQCLLLFFLNPLSLALISFAVQSLSFPFLSAINNRAIHVATLWNMAWEVGGGQRWHRGGWGRRKEKAVSRRDGEEGREEGDVSITIFSSLELFYEGRNIIFSTQASPCHDSRVELRRLKCQSPWPLPPSQLLRPLTPPASHSPAPPCPTLYHYYNAVATWFLLHFKPRGDGLKSTKKDFWAASPPPSIYLL